MEAMRSEERSTIQNAHFDKNKWRLLAVTKCILWVGDLVTFASTVHKDKHVGSASSHKESPQGITEHSLSSAITPSFTRESSEASFPCALSSTPRRGRDSRDSRGSCNKPGSAGSRWRSQLRSRSLRVVVLSCGRVCDPALPLVSSVTCAGPLHAALTSDSRDPLSKPVQKLCAKIIEHTQNTHTT